MPMFLLILATIFWGASYLLTKIALQEISSLSFIFFRFLLAVVCLLPGLVYLRGKTHKRDIMRGAQLGVLLWGNMFLQTIGLETIAASLSAFLRGFAVVFVLVIHFVVQRAVPRFVDIVASLACMAGLGLITQSYGLSWEPGVYYSLGCSFIMALYIYALSTYAGHSHILLLTLSQMTMLMLLTGLLAVFLENKIQVPIQSATWLAILFCGIFCSALGFWMLGYAQQYLSAFTVSMIGTLELVFATIFSHLFLGEVLSSSFYLGAMMVLGAIGLINWRLKELEA